MEMSYTLTTRLEKMFGKEKAAQIPAFIKLAKKTPYLDDVGVALKIEESQFHQTKAHALISLNKPVSKLYYPHTEGEVVNES